MIRHMVLRKGPREQPGDLPDLSRLEGTVLPIVIEALRASSRQLASIGVRHALVGGLAVVAYGYARNTKDVDFLVGEEAFNHHGGGLVTVASGVPIEVNGIAIDPLSNPAKEPGLEEALAHPVVSEGIPIAPVGVLIYLKLKSPRRKDSVDIIELLKLGIAAEPVRAYLETAAPQLIGKFDKLVAQAITESEDE